MITTINEFRKQYNESKKDNLPKKGTADWHQLQIAKKTVKMVPTMAAMMGGMTFDKAKEILAKYGINEDLSKNTGLNSSDDITNQINPVNRPTNLSPTNFPPPTEQMVGDIAETQKIAEYAVSLGLSKEATKKLVSTVFADPAQAPDEISIAYVQDHMGDIMTTIDNMPDSNFPEDEYHITNDMTTNILPFECIMYAKNSIKLKQLAVSLNEKIKRNGFKAIYENDIFFINTLDGMGEDNKKIISTILESEKAVNIANSVKWQRKINTKNESVESDTLYDYLHFKKFLLKYCNDKQLYPDIIKRSEELLEEIKSKSDFGKWLIQGSTLLLKELLINTTYRGNGNTPGQLLDFNSFALIDTVALLFRKNTKNINEK